MEIKERQLKNLFKNRIFLGCLAVIVALPLIGLLSSINNPPVYGKSVQTVAYLKAGSELFFEVRDVSGVKSITVTLLQDLKDAKILIEEVKEVGWDFKGIAYSKFRVSSEDADKIEKLEFTLKLERDILDDLNLKEVKLYRSGKVLDTKFNRTEDRYVYYTAFSNKMGDFVIGKAEAKTKASSPVVGVTMPEEVSEEAGIVEEGGITAEEPEIEQPMQLSEQEVVAPTEESPGFFSKIADFFKNLFN